MKSTIKSLINYLNYGFEIIMESDLVSLLFHCFISENPESINKIHSDTRVFNYDRLHFDLVIGTMSLKSKRLSVIPELLIECKIFGNSFTNSQLSKRFSDLKGDIKKINKVKYQVPKYIIVYDYCNYLNETRKTKLIQLKNNLDKKISILIIYKKNKFKYKVL